MPANGTLQLYRGTTAQNNGFTGLVGSITYDTQTKRLRSHNGSTAGGVQLALLSDIPAGVDLTHYVKRNQAETFTSSVKASRFVVGTDVGSGYELAITGQALIVSSTVQFRVNNTNVKTTGDLEVTGDITNSSDARLKTKIHTLKNALDTVAKLRGTSFEMYGEKKIGVVAQEVLEVIPEVVRKDGKYYSVAYGNIVAVLIEAIKELKLKVEALEVPTLVSDTRCDCGENPTCQC
jgi:hypothetical protein